MGLRRYKGSVLIRLAQAQQPPVVFTKFVLSTMRSIVVESRVTRTVPKHFAEETAMREHGDVPQI